MSDKIPSDAALRSRVADLLHLLQFARIETPTAGDAEQAEKAMNDLERMLAAPAAAEQPDTVAVPRELLAEAESIIDSYAEALKASHAPGGDWEGEEAALDDYEREAGVAAKLRRLLAGGEA